MLAELLLEWKLSFRTLQINNLSPVDSGDGQSKAQEIKMALTERQEVDKVEVVGQFNHVQYRTATVIERDGVEVAREFHRAVVAPGDDHTGLDPKVRAICEVVHTQDVIDAYRDSITEAE